MNKLERYARKRFKSLTEALESYHHIEDPEVLHKIRVEIKMMKALLNLIDFSVKKFKGHRQFMPLRTIFRKAGEIRQPEVIYKLLLQYEVGGVGDEQVPGSVKTDRLAKAFQNQVPQFVATVKDRQKKLRKYFDKVNQGDVREYLKKKKQELRKLLFPSFNRANLHKARKIDKEIVYLSWSSKHPKPKPFYSSVEEIIGQWHDKQVLLPIVRKKKAAFEVDKLTTACNEDIAMLKKLVAKKYSKT